ncbi:uncharacterized protein C8Q71DRAFT_710393 [Rhodofomes roseus]|uniref:Uncharacterized protein n=1 Tax=Rhodofomes roseus TaxID=34475 RepID=A0ABQ8KCQ8_9APHY|nr:uncharacterized protein C8Q71DRAFT_710393 [Rhodofomes roseus]KAH9835147.1 hypothetical protein C8Q71DRAFT_710393 [Rhodofomes roseus]
MSWANPQQQQFQVWTAPTGWVGSWPPTAPAGYSGPPPIPAGVNPQAWTSGRWQFNPMFRGPVPGAQPGVPAWAPHPSWGSQAASAYVAANNFNPYKRQPNPGDRDYWSTKLLDNPLGLENMDIRDTTPKKKTRENGVVHTPWVWVPTELCESPEHQDTTDLPNGRDGRDGREGREGREGVDGRQGRDTSRMQDDRPPTREPSRSRHERSTSTADAPSRYPQDRYSATYGSSTSARDTIPGQTRAQDRPEPRQRYDSTTARSPRDPSRSRTEGPAAEPNVVPPPPPNMPNGYSSYSSYSQQHQRQRSHDVSPRPPDTRPVEPRSSPKPPTSSASAAAAAATAASSGRPAGGPSATEAFSSRRELHPTFSPSIVRTPGHYSATSTPVPTRRSTTDESHTTSAHTRRSSGEPSAPSAANTPSRRLSGDDAHYASTPTSRRSTQEDPARLSSRAPVSPNNQQHGPIYAPASASTTTSNAPSRSNSLSKRRSSAPTPSSGSPPSAAAPLPYLASFSEEPEGLLSPLVSVPRNIGGASPSGGRELGRSSTYPSLSASTTFESIPEERALSQPRTPKPVDRARYSDPEATPYANARSPPRSSHASPESGPQRISRSVTYPVLDERQSAHAHAQMSASYTSSRSPPSQPTRSPNAAATTTRSPTARPRSPTQPSHSHSRSQSVSREHSRSRGPSPSRSSRATQNPLPRPPMPSNYPALSSASAYSSASATQPAATTYQSNSQPSSTSTYPSSGRTTRTVRKGFWNKRGDHLVYDQNRWCMVYAPRNSANPPELANYPLPVDGFMDHHGQKVKYDPNVPELPESLPLHGEPPKRPYKEVCVSLRLARCTWAHGLPQFVQYVTV